MERGYRHPYGFGHMGYQRFVPLSTKICFCLNAARKIAKKKFDLLRFSELISDKVDITKEGYELNFLGKSYAKYLTSLDPPYNTGSDGFTYQDKFSFTISELTEKLNLEDKEVERVLDLITMIRMKISFLHKCFWKVLLILIKK